MRNKYGTPIAASAEGARGDKHKKKNANTVGNRHKQSSRPTRSAASNALRCNRARACRGVGSKWIRTLLSVISQVIYWNREYLKGNGCSRLLLFRVLFCFRSYIFFIVFLLTVRSGLEEESKRKGFDENLQLSTAHQCFTIEWWVIDRTLDESNGWSSSAKDSHVLIFEPFVISMLFHETCTPLNT